MAVMLSAGSAVCLHHHARTEQGLKVLIIAPTPFFGDRGCHMRIYEEAKALIRRGHAVSVVTYADGRDPAGLAVERIASLWGHAASDERGAPPTWEKLLFDVQLFFKTIAVVMRWRPQVLHCHLHEGALIGIMLRPFFQGAVVFDSQGGLADELAAFGMVRKGSVMQKLFLGLERMLYGASWQIAVSNTSNYALLRGTFHVPERKLHLIFDGVSSDAASPRPERREAFRREAAIPPGKKVIVFLGSYTPVQGIDAVIKLAAELLKIRSDIFWLLRGAGDMKSHTDAADRYALGGHLHIGGLVAYEDSQSFLALGDFAVTLKRPTTESNGKLLHYALAGLPVICYDHATNRSLIGDFGFYLDPDATIKESAVLLSSYLDTDPREVAERVATLRAQVLARYSWDRNAEQFEQLYFRSHGARQ